MAPGYSLQVQNTSAHLTRARFTSSCYGKPRLHLYGPGQAPAVFLSGKAKSLQHSWARHTHFRTKACCLVITSLVLGQKERTTEHLVFKVNRLTHDPERKASLSSSSTLTSWTVLRTLLCRAKLWVPAVRLPPPSLDVHMHV